MNRSIGCCCSQWSVMLLNGHKLKPVKPSHVPFSFNDCSLVPFLLTPTESHRALHTVRTHAAATQPPQGLTWVEDCVICPLTAISLSTAATRCLTAWKTDSRPLERSLDWFSSNLSLRYQTHHFWWSERGAGNAVICETRG